MRYYPVFLNLEGQDCAVLGGGSLAAEKATGLLQAGARVTVVAAEFGAAMEAAARDPRLRAIRRDYRDGDLAGVRLAFDATGDPDVNATSWAEAEALGVLHNVVDRPQQCRFIAPAVVRREPLLVAISTSGESPFLASTLRARLERQLGPEWSAFTALVGKIRRRLRAARLPLTDQTRTYRRLLSSDVLSMLRDGLDDAARAEAEAIVAEAGGPAAGRVALVGAGPGDPRLLTEAARDLLADADIVFHDALIHPAVLRLAGPSARVVDVGKRGGSESTEQSAINQMLIEAARDGLNAVRLKGGDPFVFGRGGEELAELAAAGIDVVVVPGVSSAIAGPAAAGIPVTLRGVAATLGIATARVEDPDQGLEKLVKLAQAVDTLVVLMVLGRLRPLADRLLAAVGDRPAAIVAAATTERQRVVHARLSTIADRTETEAIEPPALLVVGEVVEALRQPQVAGLIRTLSIAALDREAV
jgi:uroporphyrin-III C-methyltransferase/precorrin-2 dehydrogenase/sirohydrochlorin ferrochelatase